MWDQVVIGLFGLAGVIAAGLFSVHTVKLSRAVGKPNGQGNVVQMLEEVLRGQGRLEERLDSHLRDPFAHDHTWDQAS